MKKTILSIISVIALLFGGASSAFSYSQDPISCNDPKTQYPSNPPCNIPIVNKSNN